MVSGKLICRLSMDLFWDRLVTKRGDQGGGGVVKDSGQS